MICFRRPLLVALVSLALSGGKALADVSLVITDNDATPNSTQVTAGSNFSFDVRMLASSEQTTGLDYYLNSSDATGLITIVDRSLAGSPYNDPLASDAVVEASPSNILDPRNNHDLGALADVTQNAGNYLVATYTMNISASAPSGVYMITTVVAAADEGWLDASSGEHPFTSHGTFTVMVPEPGSLTLAGLGLFAFLCRRSL